MGLSQNEGKNMKVNTQYKLMCYKGVEGKNMLQLRRVRGGKRWNERYDNTTGTGLDKVNGLKYGKSMLVGMLGPCPAQVSYCFRRERVT